VGGPERDEDWELKRELTGKDNRGKVIGTSLGELGGGDKESRGEAG